jgi:porphobilinogen synthase
MRRIRKSSGLRDMLAETTLSKSDLIQPIFIKESLKGTEEIKSMPGINRLGLDILDGEIEKIIDLGIKSIAVFPVIDEDKKDEKVNEDDFVSFLFLFSSTFKFLASFKTFFGKT